jgi:hypothetical protein
MKRLLIAITCSALAASAMAINVDAKRGDRIGVLMVSAHNAPVTDVRIAESVLNYLRDELASRGFDAFRLEATYDTLRREDRPVANYYIEIVSGHAEANAQGGVGAAIGPVTTEIGVIVGRVAAEMRVYDGQTLDLIDRFDLSQSHTTVAPTGIGFRGLPIFAWIAVPIAQHSQIRAATHAVAKQAADRISSGIHGQ